MINGPSHSPDGDSGAPSESEFRRYLNLGLHLAPTADQDNHLENWGDAADTRTGVLANSLTRGDIMEALRERRVYASEDRNLRVVAFVDGHVIGTRVSGSDAVGVAQTFDVRIVIADVDEPTATYRVQIYSDRIGGSAEATVVASSDLEGDGDYTIGGLAFTGVGQYVFLRITQQDGNRVWTAPVWFEA